MPTMQTSNDKRLIDMLRNEGPRTVEQLVGSFGVTATAIRQRLNRLTAAGLIERVELRRGRGRPLYQYRLTREGVEAAGDNLSDLAAVLWEEVQKITDPQVRQTVLAGVANSLADRYSDQIEGDSVEQRLQSIAQLFRQKEIPFVAEQQDGRPVLKIVGCPYPDLSKRSHEICELERQLLSRLADHRLDVEHSRVSCEAGCCTFASTGSSQPELTQPK